MDDLPSILGRRKGKRIAEYTLDALLVVGVLLIPVTLPVGTAAKTTVSYLGTIQESVANTTTSALATANATASAVEQVVSGAEEAVALATATVTEPYTTSIANYVASIPEALSDNAGVRTALALTGPEVVEAEATDFFSDPIFLAEGETADLDEDARLPEIEDRPVVVATQQVFTPTSAPADTASVVALETGSETGDVARTYTSSFSAYTSLAALTDSTPFIMADGNTTYFGAVANNCLPFGTRVRLPDLYGDKVFVVHDRMNSRYGCNKMDIWLPTYNEAIQFGVRTSTVEVLQ